MADSMPFMPLSQQTLKVQILDQVAAIERAKLAILELIDRQNRNNVNISAAMKAIQEIESQEALTPIEKQRLKMQVAAQNHTIERQTLENLEGQERAAKHIEQIEAATKAKADFELRLKQINAAHGELTEEVFKVLQSSLQE